MIFSDLASPAEAGFAKAGNRLPRRIESWAGFWQDHALAGNALARAALIWTRRGRPI
jgi:hypothetical protein